MRGTSLIIIIDFFNINIKMNKIKVKVNIKDYNEICSNYPIIRIIPFINSNGDRIFIRKYIIDKRRELLNLKSSPDHKSPSRDLILIKGENYLL